MPMEGYGRFFPLRSSGEGRPSPKVAFCLFAFLPCWWTHRPCCCYYAVILQWHWTQLCQSSNMDSKGPFMPSSWDWHCWACRLSSHLCRVRSPLNSLALTVWTKLISLLWNREPFHWFPSVEKLDECKHCRNWGPQTWSPGIILRHVSTQPGKDLSPTLCLIWSVALFLFRGKIMTYSLPWWVQFYCEENNTLQIFTHIY